MKQIKLLLTVFILCALAGIVYAEDAEIARTVPKEVAKAAPPEKVDLTKDDMLLRLNYIFETHLDIRSSIPGVEQIVDAEGQPAFTYNGVVLEQLDESTLLTLLRTANGKLSWRNLQRLDKQLRALKQIDQMNRTDRMLREQRDMNRR